MKKLESLKSFNSKKLSMSHSSQILGGATNATQGGSRCTNWTSTGCQAYTRDSNTDGVITYEGTSEINQPCDSTN